MPSKPHILLPAVLLVGIAVLVTWKVSINEQNRPDAPPRHSATHPRTHAEHPDSPGQRPNFSAETESLSNDDLLSIYHREGAATALAAAKSQPWPDRDERVNWILNQIATEDPEFVAAELKTSGLSVSDKGGLVKTMMKNWKDGRKALDWAENQLTGRLRHTAIAGALGILVKSEPEAAFSYLKKISTAAWRHQAISDLFEALGSHDPESALMRAKELKPEEAQYASELIVGSWAKTDPKTAAAWVLENAPTNATWIVSVFKNWKFHSPEQAQQWFDSLPEGDAKQTAYQLTVDSSNNGAWVFSTSSVSTSSDRAWVTKPVSERNDTDLRNWVIQDTEGARSFVEQSKNDPVLKQLITQVAEAISGKIGPSEAMDWALRLPEENGSRERAIDIVLRGWSEKDPAAAAEKLASMSPEQYGKLPISLVYPWLMQDPAAAADWVAGWKGENQTIMIENVIDLWPSLDPEAAYQWLGSLPAGAGRDAGIMTMMLKERGSEPDSLTPWIDLISDPHTREKKSAEMNELLKGR